MDGDPYAGREQAHVKHVVLRRYLQSLAYKLTFASQSGLTLNYVDGFSGPWQAEDQDALDTSPEIAMRVLEDVKEDMRKRGQEITVRCLFIEKDKAAHSRLGELLSRHPQLEAVALLGNFEDHVQTAVRFAKEGRDPFAFVFVDPTGWTGFGIPVIGPILRLQRREVLINLMTKDIIRFLSVPSCAASLDDLFGGEGWRDCEQRVGLDREECVVQRYCRAVRDAGPFESCVSTIVLNPTVDRAHYHLVYATASLVGLVTFREAEAVALAEQLRLRGKAKTRDVASRDPGQGMLPGEFFRSTYPDELQSRYRQRARAAVEDELAARERVPYDDLVRTALAYPMVTQAVLKEQLRELRSAGRIAVEGLAPTRRIPQLLEGHFVRRLR